MDLKLKSNWTLYVSYPTGISLPRAFLLPPNLGEGSHSSKSSNWNPNFISFTSNSCGIYPKSDKTWINLESNHFKQSDVTGKLKFIVLLFSISGCDIRNSRLCFRNVWIPPNSVIRESLQSAPTIQNGQILWWNIRRPIIERASTWLPGTHSKTKKIVTMSAA